MQADRQTRQAGALRARCATAAAYAVAAVVHLVTAGLFAAGLMLIVLGFRTVVQPVIGLLLLGLAVALRPRPERLNPDLPLLREADARTLFALLRRTADSAGARHVDAVQLTADFSVTVIPYGLRRRRCLVLGLPLWAAYSPQQRIAAITQALGRSAPRNVRFGMVIGSALRSLTAGSQALRAGDPSPASWDASPLSLHAAEAIVGARRFNSRARTGQWLLWPPRTVTAATARLLLRLTRPAAARARFEADEAGARAASSGAAVAALRDRRLAPAIGVEMHRLVVERRTLLKGRAPAVAQGDLWETVTRHAALLRERQETVRPPGPDPRGGVSGSARHDSDARRAARLADAPQHPATITLDEPDRARIEDELRPPKEAVARLVLRGGIPG
ncbi:M48 family metallopeptidase [Streptomyces sp. NBC_01498]|uniref:M48 family metallopeptidase n=1 Tax=Streptomyces sp. NBC_01498 TaxID=2975870 RepID=UPI002E7BC767|nr:M48 family metallopeptidase [Streptomyces sp. NBC_01498]WTL25760.1 M48 family metallopeptidase [Streptomyces sp. NBC_01498]